MLKTAPDPVDVQDLQFKLRCRLKVFENTDSKNFPQHCSLVACASRFGLIFIGTNTFSLQVIQVKDIEKYTISDGDKVDYPRRNLSLVSRPSHLSVNCEHTILAIVIEKNNCPCALFYDVKSFWQQEIIQIGEVRLSPTPKVSVIEVNWNPAVGSVFTACKSDGSLGVYEIKSGGVDINELPTAAGATCFSWSPKGKQIAVGSRDGKITQLKPDLKAVKIINAPPLKEMHSVLSLQWVSNYQFIGVFRPNNSDGQAPFIVIDAPKTGEPTYTNYDDICYSSGCARPLQFYTILLQSWNVLMAASSNSMEVGILGNSGESWTQWIMGDAARAELPLSSNHQETLPIGCALEIGSTAPIPWGESTLSPAPFLLLFSHHGMLCCFSIINLKDAIVSICTPPDLIKDMSGLHYFVVSRTEMKTVKDSISKDENKIEPQLQVTIESPTMTNAKAVTTNVSANTTQTSFKVQAQVTSSQGLNLSKTQAVNLFGGQATLTPITQANKVAQASVMPQYPSLYPSFSNIANKTAAASATQIPITLNSASSVSKPFITVPSIIPPNSTMKVDYLESKEDSSKSEIGSMDLKAEEEAEKIFAQMVREECIFLESELKAVLHHGKTLKFNLGSDEDKTKIIESTKLLEDFFGEVLDICVTQSSEAHILKQNLLQSWAWYEEAKSRHLASQDESMIILIRAQPLDSASEKQLADIQHTNYYLESQISQAHLALDEQWENFQDYCKKTHKIQIPTMEMIFQTMVKQNAILRKQSYVLKDIATRIKNKSRSALGPSLLVSIDDMRDLPDELKRLRMDPDDICQIQYEHVTNRMKNFTKVKADNLRSFLKKRDYAHVSAAKPPLSTSVIQASPSSKLKQHSLLLMKTPLSKEFPTKTLDFEHSTPKTTVSKSESSVTLHKSSTAIEGLQNFTLKFESKHFSNETKPFASLTKNVIASSPNSAFVSTVTPATMKTGFLGVAPTASTISSVGKTASVVTVTTSQEASHSILAVGSSITPKSFPFISSSAVPTQEPKSPTVFSNSITKPTVFSNAEITSMGTSIFGTSDFNAGTVKNTTPASSVTTKPASPLTTGFNLTSSTKSTTIVTNLSTTAGKTATSSLAFGSATASTPSFSFGSATTSNIFGSTNQKVEGDSASSAATTKPFIFSKTTLSTTTPQNLLTSKLSTDNTSTSLFGTPQSSVVTKATATSQLSLFSTPPVTTAKTTTPTVSAVASSSIFGLPSTSTTLVTTTSSIQSSIFGGTAKISSPPSAVFAVNTTKSLFASVSPSTVASSSVLASNTTASTGLSTVTIISTSNTVPVSTNNSVAITSAPSIFGTQLITTKTDNTFGSLASTNSGSPSTFSSFTSTPQSITPKVTIFGSTPTTNSDTSSTLPIGTSTTGFSFVSTSANKSSIFGSSDANTSKPSIFGGVSASASTCFGTTSASTTLSSIFGATPSTLASTLVVSTAPSTQTSLFDTSTTSVSGFGSSTASTTQPSVFAAPPPATSSFGTPATTTTQSVFGTAVSTSSSSLFGASIPSTAQSVFGSSSSNQSTIFGNAATSTAPQSIFGAPTATTAQSQGFGVFGDGLQKTSVFGNTSTGSTQATIFGSTNQSSGFGNATSTTSSVFGQNQTTNTFGQSVFGSSGSTFGTSNTFGTSANTFGQSSGSIFGSAPSTTSGNIFGGSATTGSTFASSGTVFGAPASSTAPPFGSSIFSSNTTQPSTFSGSSNTGSFGFGGLNVGSTATTSSSGFGSAASNPFGNENKNMFGSSGAPSNNSVFGSNNGSLFGTPTQTFGNGNFGSQSSPFGQQSTFGQNSFGGSSFGQGPSGPFSGGSSATVGQTGFGTASTFNKPGFGNSPVFGGSPSFGSAPSFGGAPSFGSPPAFGSPPKIFGSTGTGFGAATSTQNTGFGNLANQTTVGFGNLAQQAANSGTANAPFSGSSSFSSWR